MKDRLAQRYSEHYENRVNGDLFPTEFVVRAFLGSYPYLDRADSNYRGKSVLDLGSGDGRNIPFLCSLGMNVFGLEISQGIIDRCQEFLRRKGLEATVVLGSNDHIVFDDQVFDYVVACHSCYYVRAHGSFEDNIREIARVLKANGSFICSVPMHTSYLLRGADLMEDGHAVIRNDPLGIRNGEKIRYFSSKIEVEEILGTTFRSFSIGECINNWWGIDEHCWVIVCKKYR